METKSRKRSSGRRESKMSLGSTRGENQSKLLLQPETHQQNTKQQQLRRNRLTTMKKSTKMSVAIINIVLLTILLLLIFYLTRLGEEDVEQCKTVGCIMQNSLLKSMLADHYLACEDFYGFVCQRWAQNNTFDFVAHFSQLTAREIQQILHGLSEDSESENDHQQMQTLGKIYKQCLESKSDEIFEEALSWMNEYNVGPSSPAIANPLGKAIELTALIGEFGMFYITLGDKLMISYRYAPYVDLLQTKATLAKVVSKISHSANRSADIAYYHQLVKRILDIHYDKECLSDVFVVNNTTKLDNSTIGLIVDAVRFMTATQPIKVNAAGVIKVDRCCYNFVQAFNESFSRDEQSDVVKLLTFHKLIEWVHIESLKEEERSIHCADDVRHTFPHGTDRIYYARRLSVNVYKSVMHNTDRLLRAIILNLKSIYDVMSDERRNRLIDQIRQIIFRAENLDNASEQNNFLVAFFNKLVNKIGFYRAYFIAYPRFLIAESLPHVKHFVYESHTPHFTYVAENNQIQISLSSFVEPWFYQEGIEALNIAHLLFDGTSTIIRLIGATQNVTNHIEALMSTNSTLRQQLSQQIPSRFQVSKLKHKSKIWLDDYIQRSTVRTLAVWLATNDRMPKLYNIHQHLDEYSADQLLFIARCFRFCLGSNANEESQIVAQAQCNGPLYDHPVFLEAYNCRQYTGMAPNKYQPF